MRLVDYNGVGGTMTKKLVFILSLILTVNTFAASRDNEDPWEGVKFNASEMSVVLGYVKNFYIDAKYDTKSCWVWAADSALHVLKPQMELLPVRFLRMARHSKKWRKSITGKKIHLKKGDSFVIHQVPTAKKDLMTFKQLQEREKRVGKIWKTQKFSRKDFDRVMTFVMKHGKKDPVFSPAKAYIEATNGYLAALDPHSAIVSVKAWNKDTKEREDSSFEGIGAILTKRGHDTIVESPIEGQPAAKAGLRSGDVIIAVNKQDVRGLSLQKVVNKIRGPKGTLVVLTVHRSDTDRPLKIKIIRARIRITNISFKLVKHHPSMGYIKVRSFVPGTAKGVKQAISDLRKKVPGHVLRGLILDLRGNPGGLLMESVNMADEFLDKGVIVTVRGRVEGSSVYRAEKGAYRMPLVVLVNSDSASASEIFAGAIQDNRRGLILGDRTFGKASVQSLMSPFTSQGYYIKLTIARYYAPSGRTIQVTAIHPDILIPRSPGKPMPKAFREEDLFHHLSKIPSKYISANSKLTKEVLTCEKPLAVADAMLKSNPDRSIKFDYQLYTAADDLDGLVLLKTAGLNFCKSQQKRK